MVIIVVILGIMGVKKSFNAAIEAGDRENQSGGGALIKGFVNDGLEGMHTAGAKNANDDMLRKAVMEGDVGLVKFIIGSGANVNLRFKSGATLLHRAANDNSLEIARMLVENEANVDAKNKEGFTPLHTAAKRGRFDIVKLLIENHADINARNENRDSVLNVALSELKNLSKGNTIETQQSVIDLLRSYDAED
jgi:ankyrin repeat protein